MTEESKLFKSQLLEIRKKLEEKLGEKLEPKSSVNIEAKTLDELYFFTIYEALKHGRGYLVDEGSFKDTHRLEFDSANLMVSYPTTRPLAPQSRPGIIVTTNDKGIEDYFKNYIINGKLEDNEHYKYGAWIVGVPEECNLYDEHGIPRGSKINQLEWCINHFVNKGFGNNHCTITVGCAEALQRYDKQYKDKQKGSTECLRQITFKIKENKLNMSLWFRSWDLFAGVPENLGGLTKLMEYTSEFINLKAFEAGKDLPEIKPGILYAHSDGLHIYEHNMDISKVWVNVT